MKKLLSALALAVVLTLAVAAPVMAARMTTPGPITFTVTDVPAADQAVEHSPVLYPDW